MKRRLGLFLIAIALALAGCNNGASSGDRVLVVKYLYDANVADPERFNVIVFKFPKTPLKKNVPLNYIKRLLGLPGEILAIFLGRLYRVPAPNPGEPPHFDDRANPEIDPKDLWKEQYRHVNENVDWFDAGKFEIIRKPPQVMMALRRIVYDNDFPATDLKGEAWQRWRPKEGSGWTADKAQGFNHSGAKQPAKNGAAAKDAVDWLRYRHILRPMHDEPAAGSRKPELITDFMAYNAWAGVPRNGDLRLEQPLPVTIHPNWAGDLMLECKLDVAKAEGAFWMELSRGVHRFRARWDLASGMCTLFKLEDGKQIELDSKPTRVKEPGSYQLRFAHFDARLTIWVDRDLPFNDGRDYTPPELPTEAEKNLDPKVRQALLQARRGPTPNDLEPASIGSQGASVQVHNIRLWRNTYYTRETSGQDVHVEDWADPAKWNDFGTFKPKTMYVQPGHYLVLGDNSPQSSDSREWGTVPERLLLGRALMVYFPLDRAGPIR